MRSNKHVPKTQYEITKGDPDRRFPRTDHVRRDQDTIKELIIGLRDVDSSIRWYFQNIIKPTISEAGFQVKVPVLYGTPQRWANMQKDGFIRDKEGKLQIPVILYRRTGIIKDKTLGSRVDGNYPQLYYSNQVKYNQSNRYDQFSVLTNARSSVGFTNTIIPDFVNVTYEVLMWTDTIDQMNQLLEAVLFTEGSYWGEPERFKFRSKIDNFTNNQDLPQDGDRTIKTNFSLQIAGYIITDALVKQLAKKDPYLSQQPGAIKTNNHLSGSL